MKVELNELKFEYAAEKDKWEKERAELMKVKVVLLIVYLPHTIDSLRYSGALQET